MAEPLVQPVGTQILSTQPARETVLEALFPERRLIASLRELNDTLQAIRRTGAQVAGGVVKLEGLLPPLHPPTDLMQILLAAQQQGLARGYLARVVVRVPAGQPIRLTLAKPTTEVAFFIATDEVDVAPHSSAFTVTASEDFHEPTLTGVPLSAALSVPGVLLYPVETQLVRVITPDPAEDIEFRETIGLVLVEGTFYAHTLQPYWARQAQTL